MALLTWPQYDEDGNGWIDEGDIGAFAQLKIWAQGNGQDQLLSLTEAGGAVLGSQSTEFSFEGQSAAVVRPSAANRVFLRENGTAGTLQQIDLAV